MNYALFGLAIAVLCAPSSAQSCFDNYNPDPVSNGLDPSVAVDSTGLSHFVSKKGGGAFPLNTQLRYTRELAAGSFTTEVIAQGAIVGKDSSIVLDSQDNPQVAYIRDTQPSGGLVYWTRKVGGNWIAELIESNGGARETRIVLTPAGEPIVTFVEYKPATSTWDLRYAQRQAVGLGSAWTVSTVAYNVQFNQHDLEITPSGAVHVVFSHLGSNTVYHARPFGSSWLSQVIATDCDGPVEAAVEDNGTVHVAYGDLSDQLVHRQSSTSWAPTVVDSQNEVVTWLKLEVTQAGEPKVGYIVQGSVSLDMWYARRNSGAWTTQALHAGSANCVSPDLALTPAGDARIVYRRGSQYSHAAEVTCP